MAVTTLLDHERKPSDWFPIVPHEARYGLRGIGDVLDCARRRHHAGQCLLNSLQSGVLIRSSLMSGLFHELHELEHRPN